MPADEAKAAGLVTKVVPAAQTVEAALELADTIAAMPPLAVRAAKRSVLAAADLPLDRRPARRASGVLRALCDRGPARRDARLHGEAPADLDRPVTRGRHARATTRRNGWSVTRTKAGATSGATSRATSATSRRRRSATPRRTSSRRSTNRARQRARAARPSHSSSAADSPEHDWALARDLVRPAFRPVGTQGLASRTSTARRWPSTRCRATPSRSSTTGPAGLPVVYAHPGRRLRHRRQRRPPPVVGHRAHRAPGRGPAQPRGLGGDRAVDRRGLGRAAAHQLRHRRWPGRRPDPAARRRRPPGRGARQRRRARARRHPRAAPAHGREPAAGRRRTSRRCSPSSSSSSRAARTSRSTGGCSRSSTGGWSSSAG